MYYVASHSSGNGTLSALIGGPLLLFWGLGRLQEKRLLENTPRSKIRSAAIGLVDLSGVARQRKPLKSPVSNIDCCWWECTVEELESNGRESRWVTVKKMGAYEIFYLEDPTGRVLVNPQGAEFHIVTHNSDLDSTSQSQLGPLLSTWDLDTTSWWGGSRRMRIREQTIPEFSPLFVLGDLVSVAGPIIDSHALFNEHVRALKADPQKMVAAGLMVAGVLDPEKWDAFVDKEKDSFLKEELARQSSMLDAEKTVVQAPAQGPFVVSTQSQEELVKSFSWFAPLGIVGGIALSAGGVWFALLDHWSALVIVGLIAVGFVISLSSRQKGVSLWDWFSLS